MRSDHAVPVPGEPAARGRATHAPTALALAFVTLSLVALVGVPLFVEHRIDALRDEIENVADPARQFVTEAQLAAAWEAAAMRGFVLTGDVRFLRLYVGTRAEEERAFRRLQPLARELGGGAPERLAELRRLAAERRARKEELLGGGISPREYQEDLTAQQRLHLEFLEAAGGLEREIERAIVRRRARVQLLERRGLVATVVLALVALAAAAVVAWLAWRQARLARLLDRRARDEAALHRAAHDLTEPVAPGAVLRRIAESAIADRAVDGAYVEQISPDSAEVEITAVAGRGAPALALRVPYPGSLAEAAVDSGEPEILTDLARETRPMVAHLLDSCGACSLLVVPLRSDGRPLGALVLLRAPGRPLFSPDEVARARALASLASLALRRALLLQESEQQRVLAERLAEELRRQMESKSRLMRGVSHDIKNPLGAVLGYAELLREGIYGELSPQQSQGVDRIRASVESALGLIDDLLELARAEESRLQIDPRPVDLAALTRELVEQHRARAHAKRHQLEADLPPDLPPVRTDPGRVRQILGNLLANAIKYTPDGGHIVVGLRLQTGRRADDPDRWIALQVSDTGPGVPEEHQEAIFDEFSRLHPDATRGAGLGLAISQRIAHLLGGEITVRNQAAEGATFTLWLPATDHDHA